MEDKKILVISDSHQDARVIDEVIAKESPFDILVHCGDSEGSLFLVQQRENPFEVYAVLGNCDYSGFPKEIFFTVGYYNFFVCHGHKHRVHNTNDDIVAAGKRNSADVVLFGHTHVPEISEEMGMLLVNPGSISLPKQASGKRSYAIVSISEDYLPKAEIRYLDD